MTYSIEFANYIFDVKKYGATGDGTTDDTTAIQNAVNAGCAANGTVYFPDGAYNVTAPITFNLTTAFGVCFKGNGESSTITGTVNGGYILDRKLASPNNVARVVIEKLQISNGSATAGTGAIRVGSSSSVVARDLHLGGVNAFTTEDSAGNSSQNILIENIRSASGGIIMGGSGAILGCDIRGCAVAYRMYGSGWFISGGRVERVDTAYLLGVDSAGTDRGASGFSISGLSNEGVKFNLDFAGTCSGFYIGQLAFLNHSPPNSGQDGLQNPERGIWVRANKASNGVISGVSAGGDACTIAQIQVDAATSRTNLVFIGCVATVLAGGGATYVFPNNAYTAQFVNCSEQPVWTLSQLPSGGNVLEGDEFDISDGTNGLAWGDIATDTGTHTTHYRVRWNGSNWTVVGK